MSPHNEIIVTIILDDNFTEIDTKVTIAVNSNIPYHAIDYIIADSFMNISNRLYSKIKEKNTKENLN
jgi:hypothetical protein